MIVCDQVTIRYRAKAELAVSEISFELAKGEWLGIIGPNGAGKSTLLKGLAGVLSLEGRIELDGVGAPNPALRAQTVAYVPQNPALPVGLTTAEYVLLGRSAHLKWYQSESAGDRDRAGEVLSELNLTELAPRPVTELSGGEVQRAALARALAQDATILVLDEPTSALDLAHQIAVLELVDSLRLNHGLTVISAMHDLTLASRFAPQILLMDNGRQVAMGAAYDVLTAEVLSAHYNTPVSVTKTSDGDLVIVPLRTGAITAR